MPGFIVVLFWIWFAIGALVLIHRLLTTGSLRANRTPKTEAATEAERQATAERHAAFEAQLAAFAPTQPPTAPADEVMATTLGDGAGLDVDIDDVEREIPAMRPASPSNPDGLLPAAARARTLAEALEGIHMPCDLAPVSDDRADPRHMHFSTTTATAADVGVGLADELERLGFDLVPIDERSIAAVRPTARIEVRILPEETDGPVLGRVVPGSTVAEFQLA